MRNHNLIDQLTTDLKAVKAVSPLRNTFAWFGISLTFVAIALMMMPLRQIWQIIEQPMAVISGVWFLVNAGFLAFTANILGMPGQKNQRLVLSISFAIYLLLIGVLLGAAITVKSPVALSGMDCIVGVTALSAMPLIFFFGMVKKLAPTSPWLMGLLVGLSTCALGAFGIAFSCANEDPLHLLIFHFIAPAIFLGGFGALVGRTLLKW